MPLDLRAWLFGVGLTAETMKLTSMAKATIYKYHLGIELGNTSHHIDLPTLWERTLAVHRWRSLSRGKINVIYERAKFNRRSQGESEPVEEFITNLYVLAENCNYGILKEEMIRDRLVVGVKNFNLSEKLQLESELTLEKAIQIVRQSESVKNQQKAFRQDTENRNVDAIDKKGGRNGTFFQKTRMKGTKTYISNFPKNHQGWSYNEKRKCFRCGYYQGHSKEQCPAKDAICNKCRKKGHFAKVCHTKTIQEVSSSQNNAFIGIVGEQDNAEDKWCEVIKVNDQPIKFKIETGADVSVMPEEIYLQHFGYLKTEKADKNIFAVSKKIEKRMGQILEGLEGTLCHMDDILVNGSCQEEHDKRLETVLTRLSKLGLTLNKDKCKFAVTTIKFLGHQIDPNGIQVDPKRKRLEDMTSASVIVHCKSIYARHGIPLEVRSDNGPQFGSLFKEFAQDYGFTHFTSSPRYPQSNGFIESFVKIVKERIGKSKDPYLALLVYRATPLANGFSPAELSMGRRIRTTIPTPTKQHQPPNLKNLKNQEAIQREKQKYYFDRAKGVRELPPLNVNDRVWLTDLKTPGVIISKADTARSYMVDTPRGRVRRNRFHLLPTGQRSPHFEPDEEQYINYPEANTHTSDAPTDVTDSSTSPKEALYRIRSGRIVRSPRHFGDD
ncbi:hypothetical protein LAZ67_23000294 [Cordylochernes scorpioides]|uniref:Integrase catalytic domain-containing protein n=1 Tax=Cordylochernes scorpioides TaxID=51811 RepID=A0ABY6LSD5_9ARAC|nr:hypothetical protein LAZ67_23000294 [Cordylochernes scorpioides]